MRAGLLSSLPFFASTIALKAIEYSDRYFINHYCGTAMVGVYSFYMGIALTVQTFVFAGVVSIFYPKLIQAHQSNQPALYREVAAKMRRGTILATIGICTCAGIGIIPVLYFVNKPLFSDNIPVYWVLLAMSFVASVGYLPHYTLYATRGDKALILATFIAVAVSISGNALLVPRHGMMGAAIASLLATVAMVGAKVMAVLKGSHLALESA
jgi:O-antigen/teichoic acid export membrane protein